MVANYCPCQPKGAFWPWVFVVSEGVYARGCDATSQVCARGDLNPHVL